MFGWLQELIDAIVNAITGGFKSAANEVTNSIWNLMLKWLYNSVYSAIADFFTMMGNMSGDLRPCMDTGDSEIVYAVRVGIVCRRSGRRRVRSCHRIPKR